MSMPKLNYKNLMIILGISYSEAQSIIKKCYPKSIESWKGINGGIKVSVDNFTNSPTTQQHLNNIIKYGVGLELKKEILTNMSCLMKGKICGHYSFLKGLIPKEQYIELSEALLRRRKEYLASGSRCPKQLEKYIKELEYNKNEIFT